MISALQNMNIVTYCGTITHDPNKLDGKGKLRVRLVHLRLEVIV